MHSGLSGSVAEKAIQKPSRLVLENININSRRILACMYTKSPLTCLSDLPRPVAGIHFLAARSARYASFESTY